MQEINKIIETAELPLRGARQRIGPIVRKSHTYVHCSAVLANLNRAGCHTVASVKMRGTSEKSAALNPVVLSASR